MKLLPVLVASIWTQIGAAHPAIHVVTDAEGAIYYSDTKQVWRIAPGGAKSIAVPNVHTHELWMDPSGTLFGEHLEYHDPPVDGAQWTHRVWKRTPDGRISDVIARRKGFLSEYKDFSFHRDERGNLYWCDGKGMVQTRTSPTAPLRTVVHLKTSRLGWMSVLPARTVVVSDHGALIRVGPDGSRKRHEKLSPTNEQHSIMGVWADRGGNLYVASTGAGAVVRINPAGETATVSASPAPWRPVGGTMTHDGTLWILEVSPSNDQRVRSVLPNGESRVH
jgi:hypothetical protein